MKYDSREDARSYLVSLGGDDGKIISGPTNIVLEMPSLNNAYDRAIDDENKIEYQEYYKAEFTELGYWQMYIKRGSNWIKI